MLFIVLILGIRSSFSQTSSDCEYASGTNISNCEKLNNSGLCYWRSESKGCYNKSRTCDGERKSCEDCVTKNLCEFRVACYWDPEKHCVNGTCTAYICSTCLSVGYCEDKSDCVWHSGQCYNATSCLSDECSSCYMEITCLSKPECSWNNWNKKCYNPMESCGDEEKTAERRCVPCTSSKMCTARDINCVWVPTDGGRCYDSTAAKCKGTVCSDCFDYDSCYHSSLECSHTKIDGDYCFNNTAKCSGEYCSDCATIDECYTHNVVACTSDNCDGKTNCSWNDSDSAVLKCHSGWSQRCFGSGNCSNCPSHDSCIMSADKCSWTGSLCKDSAAETMWYNTPTAKIILIAAAASTFLTIIICICCCCYYNRSSGKRSRKRSGSSGSRSESGTELYSSTDGQ